jgi:predicted 3-demethylubiquinone-9 3-methyltransferase (glyoxalase superfamily)
MSTLLTCLTFPNNKAEEVVHFYVSTFDGKIVSTMPGPNNSVVGITFQIANQTLLAINGPDMGFAGGMSLMVTVDTQKEVDNLWPKLTTDGGKEIQCGWLVDKFGVTWQIVPKGLMELVGDKDRTKGNRAMQAMMKMKKLDINEIKKAHAGEGV